MFFVGSRNLPGGRKVEFQQDGCSNTVSYREIIPGYPVCGRSDSRHFEGEITKKKLHEYIKEIREELWQPL